MPPQQKLSSISIAASPVNTLRARHGTWMPRAGSRARVLHFVLLMLALCAGIVFYAIYRTDALPWMLSSSHTAIASATSAVLLPVLPSVVLGSFPSFVAGFCLFMFIGVLKPSNEVARCVAFIAAFVTMMLFETALGFYDVMDVLGTAIGVVVASCVSAVACRVSFKAHNTSGVPVISAYSENHTRLLTDESAVSSGWIQTSLPGVATIVFSSVLAMGSSIEDDYFGRECAVYSEEGYCEQYKRSANPVYMSYANLRNAVRVEAPRAPDRIGRVYLYENLVLLNEVNEGVHIIDNSEPTEPVNLAFIRIPGNTDIAVRDNNLYADSYVDLIILNISDPRNIRLIGREQDIFPFNALQNIPQNITFGSSDIDRQLGVVVSYRLAGS